MHWSLILGMLLIHFELPACLATNGSGQTSYTQWPDYCCRQIRHCKLTGSHVWLSKVIIFQVIISWLPEQVLLRIASALLHQTPFPPDKCQWTMTYALLLPLAPLDVPSDAFAAFFEVGFFFAKCSFNFSALSRYCAHFARMLSFALSLCASSVNRIVIIIFIL